MLNDSTRHRSAGFTLLEMSFVVVLVGILMAGASVSLTKLQKAFLESQVLSHLSLRSQFAMERLARVVGQAITTDPAYALDHAASPAGFHGLEFRLIDTVTAGAAVYDDSLRVFVYGSHGGPEPCDGLIIGRGPDLATVYSIGKGADGVLGTTDDDTTAVASGGVPAVNMLIPSTFAPEVGDMFTIDVDPTSNRLLVITLRLNARDGQGQFILPTDMVVTQKVILRQ